MLGGVVTSHVKLDYFTLRFGRRYAALSFSLKSNPVRANQKNLKIVRHLYHFNSV